jgi:MGT family glycosyltransferase
MSTFLIATMPAAGHVHPLIPIARALVERKHEVYWYTGREFAALVDETGATFTPMSVEVDALRRPERAALQGLAQLKWDLKHFFLDPLPAQVADLRSLTERRDFDVIVSDLGFLGAGSLHELGGPVWASVGMTVLTLPSRDTAPFGSALPPSRSPLGRIRNQTLQVVFDRLVMRDVTAYDRSVRAQLGLLAPRRMLSAISPYLHLQNGIAEFEYPREDLPAQVHFVGALNEPPRPAALPPWWDEVAAGHRPVVHVTQGTVADRRLDDLVRPTIEALATADVLVVAGIGATDPGELGPLPANVRTIPFISHDVLMPHLSVLVTNGGYGAVQKAIAHGVPLVVAGGTEEKPEIAARVAWSGVGLNLKTDKPTAETLRHSIQRVLQEPGFRATARRLAASYQDTVAGDQAALLLEQLAATRQPVSSAMRP